MEGAQGGDILGLDVKGFELETWTPYGKYDLDQDLVGGSTRLRRVRLLRASDPSVSPSRHFDCISFGFFSPVSPEETPSTHQEIVTEHKAELQELLKDALDSGCAVLTAQPFPNT